MTERERHGHPSPRGPGGPLPGQLSQALRVAALSPRLALADPLTNARQIAALAAELAAEEVSLLTLPELALCGYSIGDLVFQDRLLEAIEAALLALARASRDWPQLTLVVGTPLSWRHALYNCAVVIRDGRIHGAVPKRFQPNRREYHETRHYDSGLGLPDTGLALTLGADGDAPQSFRLAQQLFSLPLAEGGDCLFAIEICEDLWVPQPPSTELALAGALVILNPSASSEIVGKNRYREQLVAQQSARLHAAYVYANAGQGESTTDLVFGGGQLIAENGRILGASPLFASDMASAVIVDLDLALLRAERRHNHGFAQQAAMLIERSPERGNGEGALPVVALGPAPACPVPLADLRRTIDPHPFVPADPVRRAAHCEQVFEIQAQGLAQRMRHIRAERAVIGISGGLDSTLALLVCLRSAELLGLGPESILGITMPGFGTSRRTHDHALELMAALGVETREIPIEAAVMQHFADIGHDPAQHDITYENSQARERTQILMDIANQVGGLVIGTGDLSELALGWCTYNGDHMSMYSVNGNVPKTLVQHLVRCYAERASVSDDARGREVAELLFAILDTPISPELLPLDAEGEIIQSTEAQLGPYELHDFYLFHFLRYGSSPERLLQLASRAFADSGYSSELMRHTLTTFCRRFFSQQYKRSCLPDGPKVGSVGLSPRGDWRMPSDVSWAAWQLSDD